MAGASMNGIKSRIKSVTGTMQITKAMELVATSKLRRAKEKAERTRPYSDTLREAIDSIAPLSTTLDIFGEHGGKPLIIVLAGDRGLAGGYNANVFRLASSIASADAVYLPIGKKALDYYLHRNLPIFGDGFDSIADLGVGDTLAIADEVFKAYVSGEISTVTLVYTKFSSMISQIPTKEALLPFDHSSESFTEPLIDGDADEMLERIVPSYIAGLIYSAVCESLASESGARRTAMNSANKNAEEMIGSLRLKYNRARQAVITQEITEIVSGADAMK